MPSKANALQLLCLLWGFALIADHANQIQAQAETQDDFLACNVSSGLSNLNLSQFSGIWWEVARQPSSAYFCTKVNVTVLNTTKNNILIDTRYSDSINFPWVNQSMNATLSYASGEDANFNFSYWNPPNYTGYTMFKILDTDYTNYAAICGYTNATDNSTSFGLLLARDRTPNNTILETWENVTSKSYPNFQVGGMSLITQDETCYAAGANPTSILSAVCFALSYIIYMLLK